MQGRRNERREQKGRGAGFNPENRFDKLHIKSESGPAVRSASEDEGKHQYELDRFPDEVAEPLLRTQFLRDSSRTIVTENDSPDIPFRYSVNPYRGCEHGCIYCYARPTHEYLGMSAGLDFESKIFIKEEAPELLRQKLMSSAWKGEQITFSGNTDCYQPVERRKQLTRGCLEVMLEFRNPVSVITKNALILRDLDVLRAFVPFRAVAVFISVTSLDDELCADLEPRTSRPTARLAAIERLSSAGVPVGVNIAPVIPGLNDHEIPAILKASRKAGAVRAGFTPIRLPLAVAPLFEEWLERRRPLRKEKVLNLIRDLRGGKLNVSEFGSRMRGAGPIAASLRQMFKLYARKEGFSEEALRLESEHFSRPGDQLSLF